MGSLLFINLLNVIFDNFLTISWFRNFSVTYYSFLLFHSCIMSQYTGRGIRRACLFSKFIEIMITTRMAGIIRKMYTV